MRLSFASVIAVTLSMLSLALGAFLGERGGERARSHRRRQAIPWRRRGLLALRLPEPSLLALPLLRVLPTLLAPLLWASVALRLLSFILASAVLGLLSQLFARLRLLASAVSLLSPLLASLACVPDTPLLRLLAPASSLGRIWLSASLAALATPSRAGTGDGVLRTAGEGGTVLPSTP